jgi:hypothetical protein
MSTIRTCVSSYGTTVGERSQVAPTVPSMLTTLLTKRRAVDHCRMRSSLCRIS